MKHINNGACPMCAAIMSRYLMHDELAQWFKSFQATHPEAHTSCGGRGQLDQEACFMKRASRAHYGESAHNYGAALDLFEMAGDSPTNIYELKWFNQTLAPNIPPWLNWYGRPSAPFFELPHVEVWNWKDLVKAGTLKLVE